MSKQGRTDPVIGYMCATAFKHELGNACGGSRIYASETDLRRNSKCTDECGIVEVETRLVRIVKEPTDADPA